jgi:hypothetical protein
MAASALDSALSILESDISGIERSVDGLETWLWISSIAVIVGVALEVYFVIHSYKEDLEAWSRGIIRPPDKPQLRILLFEIASIILVVLGITGELGVGVLTSNENARLRTKNTERVQLIRQKAGAAEIEAGRAREQTEHERSARIELQKSLFMRTLTDAQLAQVRRGISAFPGQSFITHGYSGSGQSIFDRREILEFRETLLFGLYSDLPGSWKSKSLMDASLPFKGDETPGVQVWVSSDAQQKTKDAAKQLVGVLNDVHILAQLKSGNPGNSPDHNVILINVGKKP